MTALSQQVPANSVLQWSYSQHFHAEARGEEVVEHLLTYVHKPQQRKMLGAQLLDERKHVKLFREVTDDVGLLSDAQQFAHGYVSLVSDQESLPEKIFCFQILTESVSAAFCAWRLGFVEEQRLRAVDAEVLHDEERHLGMGRCLLSICDQDEVAMRLSTARRHTLLREMAAICNRSLALDNGPAAKALARMISKSLVKEARQVVDR